MKVLFKVLCDVHMRYMWEICLYFYKSVRFRFLQNKVAPRVNYTLVLDYFSQWAGVFILSKLGCTKNWRATKKKVKFYIF